MKLSKAQQAVLKTIRERPGILFADDQRRDIARQLELLQLVRWVDRLIRADIFGTEICGWYVTPEGLDWRDPGES